MATCMQCGAELKPGTKFCENCGAKVCVPQTPTQPAAVPQPTPAPAPVPPTPQQPATPPPAAPQPSPANPYAGNAAGAPPPPGGTVGNPYGNVAPGGKPPRRRVPLSPKRLILLAIPVVFLLMIIVTMISGSLRTGKPNAADPNQSTWKATRAETGGSTHEIGTAFGSGFTLDLNDKGKCVATVAGTKAYGKWTLSGDTLQLDCSGLTCTGTLKNGLITLTDVHGQGVTLYLVKEDTVEQQPTDGGDMTQTTPTDTDVGIYVLESAFDDEYTLSKEELALVDMDAFYFELRADGTGETYMDEFVSFQWRDGNLYPLTDPNTPAMTYTREGDLLTIEYDGMTMIFKRSDTKPEIDPALLNGGDDFDPDDGDGPNEPDPPYSYDDGNTYADLGNTSWYGWFRMENYKNVPNRDYFDTDTYDCWGYIGESEDGSHYFEVFRDGMPDAPVITMWVNVYDDHIEPILDDYDWVLGQNITESDAYKFNLYPYNDSISLFMYDYEGEDGTACAVSFYMRLDGTEWNEELEELPPRYEEYKAALADK